VKIKYLIAALVLAIASFVAVIVWAEWQNRHAETLERDEPFAR
jgi:hypothetical protein